MDIRVISGEIQQHDTDAIIVYLFEDQTPHSATQVTNQALGGALTDLVEGGDFTGKAGQVAVLYPRGAIPARRVIAVGLGNLDAFDVDSVRRAAAHGMRKARDLKAKRVASTTAGTGLGGLDATTSAQAIIEGSLLALYNYHGQKTDDAPGELPEALDLILYDESDRAAVERGVNAGKAFAAGTALARELVNLPPNICTPAYMAQAAQEMARSAGLKVTVLEEQQMKTLKMGALLGVAQGSDAPPRFIILEHNADRSDELDTLVLVGKGVTFDTGGYSLKTQDGMVGMKADMGGAAAVIGAMNAVAGLDVPLHVVGLAPCADNMISGHAYRPQEVVTASNGTTIEVISTDAEGRMLLADSLVYAARYKPAAVVDIATLTGSCVIALGSVAAGLFSTDDQLRDTLMSAADLTREKLWPLPLFPEYEKAIESHTADIKNTGGSKGGVGTSAIFLKHFVDYPAWAHIDMAGMAGIEGMGGDMADNPYMPSKGATGYGARLLAEFTRQWAGQG